MTAKPLRSVPASEPQPANDELDTDNDVLNVDEACKLLRISRNTLYAACASNSLPHRRFGRAIRFSRRGLMGWLATCGAPGSPKET